MGCTTSKPTVFKSTTGALVSKRRDKVQNYLIIWIDENIDEPNTDRHNTLTQLRSVVHDVKICREAEQCISYLNEVEDQEAFVILSEALGQQLVPQIHNIQQLNTIYIFCHNPAGHEQWTKQWLKIEGVFTSIQSICESLKKVARQVDHDEVPFSLIPTQMTALTNEEKKCDRLEPSFMYSIIFKEIILEFDEDDEKSMQDFIVYCQMLGVPDEKLNYFRSQYRHKTAVWWYTYESFLYGMLERAFRELNIEGMIKMRFFVRNLHRELEQLQKKQSANYKEEFIVYRCQRFSPEDFQHLLDTKGGLLAFNSFLSVSNEIAVATRFISETLRKTENNLGVLFIMTIDPKKISASTTPFALVPGDTGMKSENEILFSMHTVFRVGDIKASATNKRIWEVQLELTNDNDLQLAVLTKHMKKEIEGDGWDRLGQLMFKVGHYEQAEKLYSELLNKATSDSDRANCCYMLGIMKNQQGQYKEAILFYEKSLAIKRKTHKADDPLLANTCDSIGQVYENLGDYSKALQYYEKGRQIRVKSDQNDLDLAASYINTGQAFSNMGNYSKALELYEKALYIREKALPPNHPDLANCYNNIAVVYDEMEDYPKALQFHDKARKISEAVLPPNHPNLATCYNNIGLVYNNMDDYSKALEFYDKTRQIWEIALPPSHPDLALCYNNIGLAYGNMDNYSKALEFYDKARKISEAVLPPNHPYLATLYGNIGTAYSGSGEHSKALAFLGKSLQIKEKNLPPNHPDLADCCTSIAAAYFRKCDYLNALSFAEKALAIWSTSLPPTDSTINTAKQLIVVIKSKM